MHCFEWRSTCGEKSLDRQDHPERDVGLRSRMAGTWEMSTTIVSRPGPHGALQPLPREDIGTERGRCVKLRIALVATVPASAAKTGRRGAHAPRVSVVTTVSLLHLGVKCCSKQRSTNGRVITDLRPVSIRYRTDS
jgi:hypothetical protein